MRLERQFDRLEDLNTRLVSAHQREHADAYGMYLNACTIDALEKEIETVKENIHCIENGLPLPQLEDVETF